MHTQLTRELIIEQFDLSACNDEHMFKTLSPKLYHLRANIHVNSQIIKLSVNSMAIYPTLHELLSLHDAFLTRSTATIQRGRLVIEKNNEKVDFIYRNEEDVLTTLSFKLIEAEHIIMQIKSAKIWINKMGHEVEETAPQNFLAGNDY